ncbi:kelch-like protein 25 [Amphiura filiformis]|uniref:kelch-like protein 25 n=1 Tax=Amphiura filiformis TaxID=82378 RepID=UPI003B22002D
MFKWNTEKTLELNKPMEVKQMKVKSNCGTSLEDATQFVGPVSDTIRNDGKADVILKFNGNSFKAHKAVMREASELFENEPRFMDISWMPKQSITTEFDLNAINKLPADCQASTLDQVIDFAYTGLLPLYPDASFLDFFITAVVALEFHEALDVYGHYFRILFKSEHKVVPVRIVAEIITQGQKLLKPHDDSASSENLHLLVTDTCKYLLKEPLDKWISDGDFLRRVSGDGMVALLAIDDLAKRDEEIKVVDLALAWLKHNPDKQQEYAKQLLQKIHLGVLSRERLTTLLSETVGLPGCKELIEAVLKLMDTKDDVTIPLDLTHPEWFAARKEMIVNTLIGIGPAGFGGTQRLLYFNPYVPQNKLGWQDWCEFHPIPKLEFPIYDASVISIQGKVYIVGGCDNTYRKRPHYMEKFRWFPAPCSGKWTTDSFYEGNLGVSSYNIDEAGSAVTFNVVNPWSMLMPLTHSRRLFATAYLDGYLYAIGGMDSKNRAMKEVEIYSFVEKEWEKIADLPVPCYYACATVYKDKILVYGSQAVPDSDTPAQHNLQIYDPSTKQWTDLLTEHHKIVKFMKEDDIIDTEKKEDDGKKDKEEEKMETETEATKGKPEETEDQSTNDEDDDDCNGYSAKACAREKREVGSLLPRNALVVDGDCCFRVVYTPVKVSASQSSAGQSSAGQSSGDHSSFQKLQPVVHKLEFDFNGPAPLVKIGEPQDQKLIPTTAGEGAFQIQNKVYINMKGCVHNTGIRIEPGQKKKVDMGVWKKLQSKGALFEDLTVASYTFDKKVVFCEECVKGGACVNREATGFWGNPFRDDSDSDDELGSGSDSDSNFRGVRDCLVS